MPTKQMHADEVETDVALVGRLLADQFPQWAGLPIAPVPSAGTDNAIYRLGDDLAVRLPRIHSAVGQADKENQWLPRLAPHLPLAVPAPLAQGAPAEGYPWPWAVYRWLAGENATVVGSADSSQTAADLAHFIAALQQIDPADGPRAVDHNLRGVPLATRNTATRAPVWFHGDLLPGNLLIERGRLSAIIDFRGLGVEDPACDLMSA